MASKYEACQPLRNDVRLSVNQPNEWLKVGGLLGANRKEAKQISFRVSDDEFARLKQAADTLQMSVPSFVKKKAQGARMRTPSVDKEGAFEMARQLRSIGNNVNQIAKRAHEGGAIDKDELQGVQKELQGLWQRLS